MWEILGIEPTKNKAVIKEALQKCLLDEAVDRDIVFDAYQKAMQEAMIPETQEVMNRLYRIQKYDPQTIQAWLTDFELICRYDPNLDMDIIYTQFVAMYWIAVDTGTLQTLVLPKIQLLQVKLPHYAMYFKNMERSIQATAEKQIILASKGSHEISQQAHKLRRKQRLRKIGTVLNVIFVVWGIVALVFVIASRDLRKPVMFRRTLEYQVIEPDKPSIQTEYTKDDILAYFVDAYQVESIVEATADKEQILQSYRDVDALWREETRLCITENVTYEECYGAQKLGVLQPIYGMLLQDADIFDVFMSGLHPASQYFLTITYYDDVYAMVSNRIAYTDNDVTQGFNIREIDYVGALEAFEKGDFDTWFVNHLEAQIADNPHQLTPNL